MRWGGTCGGLGIAAGLLRCLSGRAAEPSLELVAPAFPAFPGEVEVNRCSGFDQSRFAKGSACGAPLAEPCFDFSRCSTSSGIYVHDAFCSLSNSSALLTADGRGFGAEAEDPLYIGWVFRNAAREAGVLAPTYESACIIMHVTVGQGTTERCPVDSYLWNDGANHVMVSFGDKGREGRRDAADSYAMDASSNMHPCFYRSGYDVSLPLAPKKHMTSLAEVAPSERAFFLTTKGSVYLSRTGSEERMSVVPLHDEAHGVIMSMHCFELHEEQLLPENVEYCEALKELYDDYDYRSLMNTTFALIPAGRSPGTYRLAEAMGAGAIPVIVARDVVLPFREHFDWPSFSFWFTPDQVESELMRTLRAVPRTQLEEMQHKSLEAYRGMFGDDDTLTNSTAYEPIAKRLVDILVKRVQHRGGRALTAATIQ